MKSKTQKRKDALRLRESHLAFWTRKDLPLLVLGIRQDADKPEKKAERARADIAALKKKLGQ